MNDSKAPNIPHLRELLAEALAAHNATVGEPDVVALLRRHVALSTLSDAAVAALPALLDGFVPPAELAALRSVAEAAQAWRRAGGKRECDLADVALRHAISALDREVGR